MPPRPICRKHHKRNRIIGLNNWDNWDIWDVWDDFFFSFYKDPYGHYLSIMASERTSMSLP